MNTTHDVRLESVMPRLIAAVQARLPIAEVPARCGEFLDLIYAAARTHPIPIDGQNIFLYRGGMQGGLAEAE